jgi:DNA-binding ferritin-like protein (Dps family)
MDNNDHEKKLLEFPADVINRYIEAEHEFRSMNAFIRENAKDFHDASKEIPKYLRKRYGLSYEWRRVGLAWYLLDEYFKGNITIKEDVQPEP